MSFYAFVTDPVTLTHAQDCRGTEQNNESYIIFKLFINECETERLLFLFSFFPLFMLHIWIYIHTNNSSSHLIIWFFSMYKMLLELLLLLTLSPLKDTVLNRIAKLPTTFVQLDCQMTFSIDF